MFGGHEFLFPRNVAALLPVTSALIQTRAHDQLVAFPVQKQNLDIGVGQHALSSAGRVISVDEDEIGMGGQEEEGGGGKRENQEEIT